MPELRRGMAVQYGHGEPLQWESMVVAEIRDNGAVSLAAMPRSETPEGLPAEVPFSTSPRAGHWFWAKPDKDI